jgi:hypothetical protein
MQQATLKDNGCITARKWCPKWPGNRMVNFRLLQLGIFWTFPLMVLEMAITAVFYIYISFWNISSAWTNVHPWRNEPTAYDRHHIHHIGAWGVSRPLLSFIVFLLCLKNGPGAVHESLNIPGQVLDHLDHDILVSACFSTILYKLISGDGYLSSACSLN